MKKILSLMSLLAGLCTAIDAHAYNEGGHYYTLLALFDSQARSAPEYQISEMKLQALCAELPDMAKELDAITQRVRVLGSGKDFLWGLLGQCQSTVSSHMVTAQYYLHGLSGAPAYLIREAAKDIINNIDGDLAKLGIRQSPERRNLICARGFAAHLYGDTFAHVRLSSENTKFFSNFIDREMYPTGLGHLRDGHNPDYLYGHKIEDDQWPHWVLDAAGNIAKGSDPAQTLNSHLPCQGNIEKCEEPARDRLEHLVTVKKLLVPGMQDRIANGSTGIGGIERSTTCDQIVSQIFTDPNDRPQCDSAWNNYLAEAIPVFQKLGIDPASRPNASAGKNCSAWHCAGNSSYGSEASSSCTIDDKLQFGSERP